MHRRLVPLLGLVAILSGLMLWLIAVPAASAGNPCFHDFKMPATSTGSGTDVTLEPCAFAPTVTSVPVGSTVAFHNGPTFTHLITGANQAWGSRDIEVQPNATVTYTFDAAGTYPYACALHPGMSGVIVVGGTPAAGAATTGSGSDAAVAGATASPSSPTDIAWVAAVAAGVGAIVGALIVWARLRRRSGPGEEPVALTA